MLTQALKISGDRLADVSLRLRSRAALRNASGQARACDYKYAVFVPLNDHTVFHIRILAHAHSAEGLLTLHVSLAANPFRSGRPACGYRRHRRGPKSYASTPTSRT